MKFKTTAAMAFLLGTMTAAANSSATTTVVPGVMCTGLSSAIDMDYNWDGSIANATGDNFSYESVLCGLPRLNATQLVSGNVWVRVDNVTAFSSDPVYCEFDTIDASSLNHDFSTTSTTATGLVSMAIPTTGMTNYSGGSYIVSCDLEGSDSVRSVKYTEP
jgi:hypothetical protein